MDKKTNEKIQWRGLERISGEIRYHVSYNNLILCSFIVLQANNETGNSLFITTMFMVHELL